MIGVVRSPGAPAVLTQSTAEDRYRHREVVERLFADFHGKCYICEVAPLLDAEVEHLLPHKGGTVPGRKFAWDNLFLSCRHCNGTKNKAVYEGRVIDCCRRDPEELLEQELVENRVQVGVLVTGDAEVTGTAALIEEVFSSSNPPLRSRNAQARLEELQKLMNRFYAKVDTFHHAPGDPLARRSLSRMLTRKAKFAGFTRCFARKHLDSFPELAQFLD